MLSNFFTCPEHTNDKLLYPDLYNKRVSDKVSGIIFGPKDINKFKILQNKEINDSCRPLWIT
jgi:hypothetical protein